MHYNNYNYFMAEQDMKVCVVCKKKVDKTFISNSYFFNITSNL